MAQERLVTLGELIEGICHELNNSLNIFINYVSTIETNLKEVKTLNASLANQQLFLLKKIQESVTNPAISQELELISFKITKAETESQEIMLEIFELYFPTIKKHSNLMTSIFKNMIFHGIGSSQRKNQNGIEQELLDVNRVITQAIKVMTKALLKENKNIEEFIKFNGDGQIAPFYLNSTDFTQIIINLIKNAFDATNEKLLKEGTNYKHSF